MLDPVRRDARQCERVVDCRDYAAQQRAEGAYTRHELAEERQRGGKRVWPRWRSFEAEEGGGELLEKKGVMETARELV